MSKQDVEQYIREQKHNTRSIDDHVKISHEMWEHVIPPGNKGLKASEFEESLGLDLDYDVGTSLDHLEEIDIVDAHFESHNEWHPLAEWKGDDGEIVFGDELDAAVREAIDALVEQMSNASGSGDTPAVVDGGATAVRRVVADEFDYAPEKIDDYLQENNEDVDTLNKAVQAVKESDQVVVTDDYGEIDFIPRAYYYTLTSKAVRLYEK
jgi:hypothetical protein